MPDRTCPCRHYGTGSRTPCQKCPLLPKPAVVGFFCDTDASDKITFDAEELAGAEWFERENIPLHDDYNDVAIQERKRVEGGS